MTLIQKELAVIIILLFVGTSIIPSVAQNISEKSPLILNLGGNHAPIRIIGNEEFTTENGVTGGIGTENDPYIIENWIIEGDGVIENGIFITNTTAYFIICNCTITDFHHANKYFSGIKLEYVENGSVSDSTLSKNHLGINIRYSANIKITNCSCYNYPVIYADGIACSYSHHIIISDYECHRMYNGIDLSQSSDITLRHSSLHDNTCFGFDSYGYDTETMRIYIENCSIYNNDWGGIRCYDTDFHPSYSVIKDCEIYMNGRLWQGAGIYIDGLSHNIIVNCTIHDNSEGVALDTSHNIIRNCSIYNHIVDDSILNLGINLYGWIFFLEFTTDNTIINCDIFNNEMGIGLFSNFRLRVEKNNIYNNTHCGIDAFRFYSGIFNYNNFENNGFADLENYTCCISSQQSYIDMRNNWWGSPDGPDLDLAIGFLYAKKLIHIKKTDGEISKYWHSILLFRPWLTEPVADAGRHTYKENI